MQWNDSFSSELVLYDFTSNALNYLEKLAGTSKILMY